MITNTRRGVSFVLVLVLILAIPMIPSLSMYNNVYAAGTQTIDLSQISNKDVRLKASGDAIYISTDSSFNLSVPSDTAIELKGTSINSGAVVEKGSVTNITKMSIKLNGAKFTSTHAFKIQDGITLSMELDGDNYITSTAMTGAGIELYGADTSLIITGSGFLSSVMSHPNAEGAGIGAGYVKDTSKVSGDIHIGGHAKIYTETTNGVGIGGGMAYNEGWVAGKIDSGEINIYGNASVSAIVNKNGAGIGGGYTDGMDSKLISGDVNIAGSASVSAIVKGDGAGIGGGYSYRSGNLVSGKINIKGNTSVTAIVNNGAGIGGGRSQGGGILTSGDVNISDSASVRATATFGAGIGGGDRSGTGLGSQNFGDVHIKDDATVYSYVGMGAGIGGGNSRSGMFAIQFGNVYISGNSSISAIADNGAGIGSGYANQAIVSMKTVSIQDDANVYVKVNQNGAGIGAGHSRFGSSSSVGNILISGDVIINTIINNGAGIGGGFVTENNARINTGKINVSSKASINATVKTNGAGIGGGYASDSGRLTSGDVNISGGFVTAVVSNSGVDIGDGYKDSGGTLVLGEINITGGSVYAKNNKINPVPTDGINDVYKVTVPAIASEKGKDIIVPLGGGATYKAKMISDEKEHGDSFPASASAFIYLPEKDSYTDITVGALGNKAKAKVVTNPSVLSDNLVMLKGTINGLTLSPSDIEIEKGKNATLNFTATFLTPEWWQYSEVSNVEVSTSPTGIVSCSAFTDSALTGKVVLTSGSIVGATTLILSSGGLTASALITVKEPSKPPTSYTINASATTGGNISESGDIIVNAGEDKTFTFAALSGYKIKNIIVDGVSKGAMDSYTFEQVSENHTIRAEFERDFPFVDVTEKHWARAAVEYVYYNGIMKGVDATHFDLIGDTSRAMFISTIGRMNGVEDGPAVTGFTDTNDKAYYANHVKWGVEKGIVKGISKTTFEPDSPITREQAAVFMVRYAESKGISLATDGALGYTDLNDASKWAKDSILKAQNAGIMQGVGKGKFAPKKNLSRAEVAQLIMNFDKLIGF